MTSTSYAAALLILSAAVGVSRPAHAQIALSAASAEDSPAPATSAPIPRRDARDEAPRLGLVESPYGLAPGAFMAGLTGTTTSKQSENHTEGGVRLGVSPLSRLTVHGLVGRDDKGHFSPVLTANVRLLGGLSEGYAIGLLAQYKAEGFAELGGEAEIGALAAMRAGRLSLMGNLVAGVGVEEEEVGEMDGEVKARIGYDVASFFRVGAEGQFRRRLAGDRSLAGGRKMDALGGPQLTWLAGPVALALAGGPTTVGVAQGSGAYGMLTVAAVTR